MREPAQSLVVVELADLRSLGRLRHALEQIREFVVAAVRLVDRDHPVGKLEVARFELQQFGPQLRTPLAILQLLFGDAGHATK